MEATTATQYPELGFYALPGHVDDPRQIVAETTIGERLGLGSVWIAERLNTKDVAVLSGAAAVSSERMGIATGLIGNLPLRHPLVVASFASTMAVLTGDRFTLGIGRGLDPLADTTGTPRLTLDLLGSYVTILRSLWRGEEVSGDSPGGTLNGVKLGMTLETPPPIVLAAMGEKTAYWAGQHCDGVLLNSLWSKEAVARTVELVRNGATDAGRDPSEVKVWTILITACEVPEETMLRNVIRRMNTYLYFPPQMDGICRANGWDLEVAAEIRAKVKAIDAESASGKAGPFGDENVSRELDDLRRTADLYPQEWIEGGNAAGGADHCAQKVRDRFEAGADGVLFHGTSPQDLGPLLDAWPAHRPDGLEDRPANPGLAAPVRV